MNTYRLRQQLHCCLEKLRRGELAESDLLEALELAGPGANQDLLYLQAAHTGLSAQVIGMSMVCGGKVQEPPADPAQWPYQTVLAAINDGWRVLKFPELALLLHPDETIGLGCEFILER